MGVWLQIRLFHKSKEGGPIAFLSPGSGIRTPIFLDLCIIFFIYFSFILEGLGLDFGGSRVSFWEDFGGLGDPGDPLGDPGPPKSDPDRFFLDFRVPWGSHFGIIFRGLGDLGALLEALGALLEALGPLLGAFWANVVIFHNF